MASVFLPSSASWPVVLRLHLLDAHFQPPRRHGEFGAQLILVGANFGDRQRRRRFQPPHGQPDGAIMDQGDEQQSEQRRDKKPDPEKHDRFDHDTTLWRHLEPHIRLDAGRYFATRGRGFTSCAAINLNRDRPPRHKDNRAMATNL